MKSVARMLAGNFWADLEHNHPELAGSASLALPSRWCPHGRNGSLSSSPQMGQQGRVPISSTFC